MISPYTSLHQKSVMQIANLTLGEGYLSNQILFDFENSNALGFVALRNQEVVGFAFALILSLGKLKQIIGLPEETLPKEKSKRIALFKTMAIDPLFQNQGYGTALTDARLKGIESMGIKTVFAIAWKTDQTINMFTILSKHGFQEVATLKNYWRADSLEKKYVCPACGGPPCTCDAVIFKKTSTLS